MSDKSLPTNEDFARAMAEDERLEREKRERINQEGGTRERVFKWLLSLGVHRLEVRFDGSGDSGQIEQITCHNSRSGSGAGPSGDIITPEINLPSKLQEYIEEIVYDATSGHDWANNEGGYGMVDFYVIDKNIDGAIVPAGTIAVEISIRMLTTDDFCYDYET